MSNLAGPDVLRKLPQHVLGIPNAKGELPRSALVANAMLDSVIDVVRAGCAHGAAAMFESAVSRDAASPHAIPGREDHASMWTYPNLKRLAADLNMRGVTFDQGVARAYDGKRPRFSSLLPA